MSPVFIVLKKKKKITTPTGVLAELVRVNPYTLNDYFNSKDVFFCLVFIGTQRRKSHYRNTQKKKYVSVTDANLLERYRLYLNKGRISENYSEISCLSTVLDLYVFGTYTADSMDFSCL